MVSKRSHILSLAIRCLKFSATFNSQGIRRYRAILNKSAPDKRLRKAVSQTQFVHNGIKACRLEPENMQEGKLIMYSHGGGYIAGSIQSHMDLGMRLALSASIPVVLFNYRLAPENPFPAGLEDMLSMYQHLTNQYQNTNQLCLAGDSAGGGLTLALCALLKKREKPLPNCIALVSPWIDLECRNASHTEKQLKDPILSTSDLKRVAGLYTDADLKDPLVSPINSNFSNFPPVLLQAGTNEILLDDTRILAHRLSASGVDVNCEIWEEMFHVWHYFARFLPEGKEAIAQMASFINSHL